LPSILELDPLSKDGPIGKGRVAPAVVEVEMAVDDETDVLEPRSYLMQGCGEVPPPWSVMGIDVGVNSHPAVHQQGTQRVIDEVAKTRLDSWRARFSLCRGPDEVPEINTAHDRICHGSSVPRISVLAATDPREKMGDLHIFRVTVRGKLSELSESQRVHLIETLDDHHVTKAAYTDGGTVTYDSRICFFSLRYEIRLESGDPDAAAAERGLKKAETFLRTLGIRYQNLRVTTLDMRSIWASTAKRRRSQIPNRYVVMHGVPGVSESSCGRHR
jgi:hypothetical protein